jgi:hypothetical protein
MADPRTIGKWLGGDLPRRRPGHLIPSEFVRNRPENRARMGHSQGELGHLRDAQESVDFFYSARCIWQVSPNRFSDL